MDFIKLAAASHDPRLAPSLTISDSNNATYAKGSDGHCATSTYGSKANFTCMQAVYRVYSSFMFNERAAGEAFST